jgi:hypothetical protein
MCGRVRLSSDVSKFRLVFGIPPDLPVTNFPASWTVAAIGRSSPPKPSPSRAPSRGRDLHYWSSGFRASSLR